MHTFIYFTHFFCRLRSIATHRDHFVRRLSVRPSVCPSVTLAELCFAGDTCILRNATTIFECMVSYIIYLHALFTRYGQHTLFLGGSKHVQQKPCAFVDFCSVVSFHWSKMLNTHRIKVNEVTFTCIRLGKSCFRISVYTIFLSHLNNFIRGETIYRLTVYRGTEASVRLTVRGGLYTERQRFASAFVWINVLIEYTSHPFLSD